MKIKPVKRLNGEIAVPGDKSISHRAVMAGALAKGVTRIKNMQNSDDCNYTIRAFKDMGINICEEGFAIVVKGKGLKGLTRPAGPLFVGSSGTTMRILAGILAGQSFESVIAGDEQLSARPMKRIAEPLSRMGVSIGLEGGEYPPISIKGGEVKPIDYKLPVPSAQVKSAILFSGLYAKGETSVREDFKSRDHTERMLKYFGARIRTRGLKVSVRGGVELKAKPVEVPGDISSAAFFMAGATILKGSRVRINDVGINPTRTGIINVLGRMGAKMKILNKKSKFEPVADIIIESHATKGTIIREKEIPTLIDELPAIFVVAALSKGRTVIKGAAELRVKETDRMRSMREDLTAMGARFRVSGDDIVIDGATELKGARLTSFGDHRTCMAMTIAALAAKGDSEIDDVTCVSKSFPGFFDTLERLEA